MKFTRVILASGSPRRREILAGLGVPFTVMTADADEHSDLTDPAQLVRTLAVRKAEAVRNRLVGAGEMTDGVLILAADTVVACEGEILGKPQDPADAERMLRMLSGNVHCVYSGICVLANDEEATESVCTRVTFSPIPEGELQAYLAGTEPYDKAGAYAIQGGAALWISGIEGCYYNVVGLPVNRLSGLLRESFGCSLADLREVNG